jgi:hypothetical protein
MNPPKKTKLKLAPDVPSVEGQPGCIRIGDHRLTDSELRAAGAGDAGGTE